MKLLQNRRILFFMTLMACLWANAANPATGVKKIDGSTIYKKNCSVCHGDKGDGKSRAAAGLRAKPRNFTSKKVKKELTKAKMIQSVKNGISGSPMIAWGKRFSAEEVESVVDFIRSTFMQAEATQSHVAQSPAPQSHAKRSHAAKTSATTVLPGQKLYQKNCAVCHGDRGDGNSRATVGLRTKPRKFTAEDVKKRLTRERMIESVRAGVGGTPMVAWGERLGIDAIEDVVDYIRMTFMGKTKKKISLAKLGEEMAEPMVKGLFGDPKKGGKFYNNNCYVCHGKTGEGNGPRSKFINPKPRNFRLLASRIKYNRPTLFKSISNGIIGSEMPSWNKVLSDQQIADVAEYVFQKFISQKKSPGKLSGSK